MVVGTWAAGRQEEWPRRRSRGVTQGASSRPGRKSFEGAAEEVKLESGRKATADRWLWISASGTREPVKVCEHRALEERPGGLHQTNENPVARGRPGRRLSQWARKEVGRAGLRTSKGKD